MITILVFGGEDLNGVIKKLNDLTSWAKKLENLPAL
ncbi:hypothetical protein SAMN05192569_10103 [Parageobacillus thermantarcticus]|uniref:Uncharacterized protein n=1 Tax=Parageobacillus thermantarcticus TaxID=186116 RepID=A0A1I0T1K6_9BACL|nr:hypothetical protein SAMN05192569_10103 [Parageobacillus thermantarcticus]